jgi:dUTP pyrophosphatase
MLKHMNSIKNWLLNKLICLFVSKSIRVKYMRLSSKVKPPTKAYLDDAGLDLYSSNRIYIPKGEWRIVKTGLIFEIPLGWHMQIHTRSSYGKLKIRCHLGIIDSGYRNEVLVVVSNDGFEDFVIEEGSKFCQVLFLPTPELYLDEMENLNDSDRGKHGFGSSGK